METEDFENLEQPRSTSDFLSWASQIIEELRDALNDRGEDGEDILVENDLSIPELEAMVDMVENYGVEYGDVYDVLMTELDEQQMNRRAARGRSNALYSPRTQREPLNMSERVSLLECPICLQDSSEPFVQLPTCKHIFHRDCITDWAGTSQNSRTRASCPLCRTMFFGRQKVHNP
jgi:hypothetical protein